MSDIIPQWKIDIIKKMYCEIKNGKKLKFIHIPKCAGSYASQYIEHFGIINNGHKVAKEYDEITIGIIRNPIQRFESFLNFRLSKEIPGRDWPKRLHYLHYDKTKTLNEIIEKLTITEILSFDPFKTYLYWTQNIKLLVTINEFLPALYLLGYSTDKKFPKMNVSDKNRGTLSEQSINKLKKILKVDMKIYNYWTRKNR